MWGFALLILLSIILYLWIKQRGARYILRIKDSYLTLQDEYAGLAERNTQLKDKNDELKIKLEQTVAIYAISKQICKSLDEAKVFASFKEEILKYIHVDQVKFIKDTAAPAGNDYTALPLRIGKHDVGCLLAKGVKEAETDKFYILANQFLLGLRRSLLYQKVQELAIMDSLTSILSRRYFLERFYEELARSSKFKYNFSFLMVDIDHFKEYNDKYGHLVGDVLLREVSKIMKENLRQIDLVGRYGGEEFSIILTETDKEGSLFAAERIRQSIENRVIRAYDEDLRVTISIGIAVYPWHGQDANTLIERADQALYRAKEAGRNKTCIYELQNK